jgi:hypothetical protein
LSCGYFKATKRFYPVPTFHRRDLTYVADRIAVVLDGIDLTDSAPKRLKIKNEIQQMIAATRNVTIDLLGV